MKFLLIAFFATFFIYTYCVQKNDIVRIMRKGLEDQEGNVEVFVSGEWTGVCADSNAWDMDAIEVVCGQLSYAYATDPENFYYRSDNISYSIYDVFCTGNEQSILDCSYKNYTDQNTYQCVTPATAACITAEELLIYTLSVLFSCVFCCCSIMVLVLMCLVIASCPLAVLVSNQHNGRNENRSNRGEDPSQPLLIANPYNKQNGPPAYTQ